MTLIQSFNCGGSVTVMSCDTRQVIKNPFGGFIRIKDANSKLGRISPYCIFGGGGDNRAIDRIRGELDSLSIVFLSEFVTSLQDVINKLKKNIIYRNILHGDGNVQILITGFNEDGTSGYINYNSGKKQKVVYEQLDEYEELPIVISPSSDENTVVYGSLQMDVVNEINELPSNYIGYMLKAQTAFNLNDEETVSDTFCYCAIFRNPDTGEYHCFEDKVSLKEKES